MSSIPNVPPEAEAEKIYWQFNDLDLTTEEIKKCCCIVINKLIENSDTINKVYWGEAKAYIKTRGELGA